MRLPQQTLVDSSLQFCGSASQIGKQLIVDFFKLLGMSGNGAGSFHGTVGHGPVRFTFQGRMGQPRGRRQKRLDISKCLKIGHDVIGAAHFVSERVAGNDVQGVRSAVLGLCSQPAGNIGFRLVREVIIP